MAPPLMASMVLASLSTVPRPLKFMAAPAPVASIVPPARLGAKSHFKKYPATVIGFDQAVIRHPDGADEDRAAIGRLDRAGGLVGHAAGHRDRRIEIGNDAAEIVQRCAQKFDLRSEAAGVDRTGALVDDGIGDLEEAVVGRFQRAGIGRRCYRSRLTMAPSAVIRIDDAARLIVEGQVAVGDTEVVSADLAHAIDRGGVVERGAGAEPTILSLLSSSSIWPPLSVTVPSIAKVALPSSPSVILPVAGSGGAVWSIVLRRTSVVFSLTKT